RMTNGIVVDSRISTPPIVGVPCFCSWPSGMSPWARTNCPTSCRLSQAMKAGPRNRRRSAAVMAEIRTLGTGSSREEGGEPAERKRAGALPRPAGAGPGERGAPGGAPRARRDPPGGPPPPPPGAPGGAPPDRDRRRAAGGGARPPHLAVVGGLLRPEL